MSSCRFYGKNLCIDPKNLISLSPVKRCEVRRIRHTGERVPIEEMQSRVRDCIHEIVRIDDGKIHLVIAATGTGKTESLISAELQERCILSAPNYKLLEQIGHGVLFPKMPSRLAFRPQRNNRPFIYLFLKITGKRVCVCFRKY